MAASAGLGFLAEAAEVLLLALGLYLVISLTVATVHVIGSSMNPTLQDQDYVVATKIDYHFHGPQRGDIIIMRDPYDPSKDFIKRVVGLPGERILVRDARVYIGGRVLQEPYTSPEPWVQFTSWPNSGPAQADGQRLGPDEYFVMGDNRNHSQDSRFFGPVHRDQIEARAWLRVLPVSELGPVDRARPVLSPIVTLPQAA